MWRATQRRGNKWNVEVISIHALRVEGDRRSGDCRLRARNFNPRPPCGGRPWPRRSHRSDSRDFNPRPPCGGRPPSVDYQPPRLLFQSTPSVWRATISHLVTGCFPVEFQSTPSVWRATISDNEPPPLLHFNPRPPCGGRLRLRFVLVHPCGFQSTPSVWRATALPASTPNV